ncbi:hypothetical protein ABFS82_08G174000 [Erythranthe guttata]|uniref:splicing factor, suppressor of white-apricot homolog isoform X1 n=2 Tax=Erythranthe guttata TaxID=4155 RepID=UPI00064D8C02|nr:PREDICTED: splicing factor, suppressor of white-apricot homolog isoform X1 [Erythranthe guttata]|eukprot:XP_012841763.1 PREDICTED: splicing factor, suppressor of white-apricot homolog isoform X1 [Erythranthe guttata]
MDLGIVGRHALFFDDDSSAAFVNSGNALVEWHSLLIDRYDVRHLLSAPPPPRRRNRNSERLFSDDPSLEALLDQERYIDLSLDSDQPDVEEEEKPTGAGSYSSVAFSYGSTGDSTDQKNTDTGSTGMESSGFLPPFPVPGYLLQSLPPTEKLHQIIARTAIFVSKNGGQSEIILRVKQGDNPTFGFLMPDHHLHPYFRYLIEHPELLHSEIDGNSQHEKKRAGSEDITNGVGGALSLLGSVYDSEEEEESNDTAKIEKNTAEDGINAVNTIAARGSKESMESSSKDESVPRNPILSGKEKVPAVKKTSLITVSKPKSMKGVKKEDNSGLFSTAAEKSIGTTSKIEPLIIEPPPELMRLIDKVIEFITRNGKQFEATLIEQDTEHTRFPFLRPSNLYHPYYLNVLQKAQESKANGESFNPRKDELVGRGTNKKASAVKKNDFDLSDLPVESDRKEKFKMVIGKSKKEAHETEPSGAQESEVTVDAAAAAAILHNATRGIKNSDIQTISRTHLNAHSQPDKAAEMPDQNGNRNLASDTDPSVANLTEEQKLKAERLKRAKMFVAMLKSGAVPSKTGVSRGPSVEPLETGALRNSSGEVNLTSQEKEYGLDAEILDKPSERLSKRKYRSRPGGSEDDDEDKDKDESHSRKKYKSISRSRRHKEYEKFENAVKKKHKHYERRHGSHSPLEERESSEEERDHKHYKHYKRSRKKHRSHHSHSSSEENENRGESSEDEDRDHRHYKLKHRSHHYSENEDDSVHEDNKRHSRKRSSHHSSHESSKRRDSSKPRKKHSSHSHRSSKHHHSRDKYRHKNVESPKGKESSEEEIHHRSQHKKDSSDERGVQEEGEISSRVAVESKGIMTSSDNIGSSSQQRASSQPLESDVPDDLRLKIRAMLLATRM